MSGKNSPKVQRVQNLRRSSAAQPHQDLKRKDTRKDELRSQELERNLVQGDGESW